METLILKENNAEIRKAITDSGINCCPCCTFEGASWLDYKYSITDKVHGVGYWYDGSSSKEEIERFVKECKEPYYCKDVNEFINKIKEQQQNGKNFN